MAIENIMNDKVKKVLSYIGVACLGAFIGMGALIGVSSCSQQDNNTQVKAKVNKKAVAESDYSYFSSKDYNYLSAVYNQNQTNPIYLEQSIIQEDLTNYMGNFYYYGSFIFYDNPQKVYPSLEFSFYLNKVNSDTCSIQLRNILAFGNGNKNLYTLSDTTSGIPYLVKCNITNRYNDAGQYFGEDYLGGVFDFYFSELSEAVSTYEFAKQINYYAPYGDNISTFAVNEALSTSAGYSKVIEYNLPFFESGGFLFNCIRVFYSSAQGMYWEHSTGNIELFSASGFVTYIDMEYVNTISTFGVVVNRRNSVTHEINNGITQVKVVGSSWVSSDFQKLTFFADLTPQQMLDIKQFNNNIFGDTYSNIQNNDIGLGNVFSLISLAFSSWVPILSITIVPGVTIGLLLFLPLIAGIIVLVIWIVKR